MAKPAQPEGAPAEGAASQQSVTLPAGGLRAPAGRADSPSADISAAPSTRRPPKDLAPPPGSLDETLQRLADAPVAEGDASLPDREPAADPNAATEHRPLAPLPRKRAHLPVIPGYDVLAEVGRGGMGVVYKARQKGLNRIVALKMVLGGAHAAPVLLVRFHAEAEAVAGLQHPNIVQIHEIGEQAGHPFFSMEFIEGKPLDQRLAGTPQPTRAAAELVEALARAVQAAHQRGIVHRDLKPANILLAAAEGEPAADGGDDVTAARLYGVPKITDFGLAKRLDSDDGQTRTGDILGTPSYMAPEQAAGKAKEVGPTADVYALGAILYELLTGRPPFKAATPLDTLWQVMNEEPLPPSTLRAKLPHDLETVCLKCLAKDPRQRYATGGELAEDLRRHLSGEAVLARSAGRPERLWRWCRRNPLPASLLVAITLGSALGLWHLSRLSESLVRSTALESAAQQAHTLDEMNQYYTRVANHLKKDGIRVYHDWEGRRKSVPVPATFTIELGQQIGDKNVNGVQIRLYSDYPFRARKDGGARDEFEKTALAELRRDPEQPYYRFEEYQGRLSLRYATARRMAESCLDCHNNHPDSVKKDWQVGDVRGVLEIIRPLDRDAARVQEGLRGTFLLVAGVGGGLLVLSGLVVVVGRRRRARAGAAGASG